MQRRFLVTFIDLRVLCLALLIVPFLTSALMAQASTPAVATGLTSQTQAEIVALKRDTPIERDLSGAEKHGYQLALAAGEYANVTVEQRGIDVVVQVLDASGKLVAEFDSESRTQGWERVGLTAESPVNYQLSIKAKYSRAHAGRYEIRVAEIRVATEQDRSLFEVHKLSTQASSLESAGKYDDAKKLAMQALELGEKALGPNNAYVGYLVARVASLERAKGEYGDAERMFQRAVSINQKALGTEDPQTALSLDGLGLVYLRWTNDDAKAEQNIQQALEITERTLGSEHPRVATCLMQISALHETRGYFDRALAELKRALAIAEKTLEPDDILFIGLLHNLGDIYLNQNDYDHAEPLTERALKLWEQKFGPDHPNVALSLQNLGSIARVRKQYPRALELLWRAQKIREKALGARHPQTAALLLNIGNVYKDEGDNAKALELYQRALDILETAAGPYADLTMMSLANIANTYAVMGNTARSLEYQTKVDQVVDKKIELNLTVGSERQKLAYSDWMSERTDRTISLRIRGSPNDPAASELAALAVLRRKGRVLDAMSGSLVTLRQQMDAEDQGLLDQLSTANTQLAKLALNGPGKTLPAEYQEQLASLEDQKEKLEAQIGARSAEFRAHSQPVTLAAIRAAIPPDAALIEFAAYRPFDPGMSNDELAYSPPHYIAYVLRRQGDVRWKELGPAKDIDEAIATLRKALSDPHRRDVQRLARAVDEKLMQPVRLLSGDARQLLISPDGDLNLLPFEALSDERGRYLVERYSISYLTAGRDLLRMQVPRESKSAPVVIADPSFGEPQTVQIASIGEPKIKTASRTSQRRSITTGDDLSSVYFAPLAGTAEEARTIKSLFPDAKVLTGPMATKSALKQTNVPSILHIATHGFFLMDVDGKSSESNSTAGGTRSINAKVKIENPLLRSGLALAGANLSKDGNDNGILTALEASNLNLWGTKLVTLSACDTGVGEVKNGEGVYGLRRAFFLAGTETLVMSLWPVSDYTTREMMTAYYSGLKNSLGRGEALRQAQLSMLKRKGRQHPFYWASFIQSGEWANLNGQR